MKTLLYISAVIFIIGLIGCTKEKKDEGMLLSATIIDDCSGKPLANFPMILDVDYTCYKLGGCVDTYFFDTDANGSFSLFIEKKGSAELRAYNGTSILKGIPLPNNDKELHLGTFVACPTTSFVYRIKVNNSYNMGDTLVTDLKGLGIAGRFMFAAPLQDTSFEVTNYSVLSPQSFSTLGFIPVEIGHGVFKNDIFVSTNWVTKYTFKTFNIPVCQLANTQEVVLEIN